MGVKEIVGSGAKTLNEAVDGALNIVDTTTAYVKKGSELKTKISGALSQIQSTVAELVGGTSEASVEPDSEIKEFCDALAEFSGAISRATSEKAEGLRSDVKSTGERYLKAQQNLQDRREGCNTEINQLASQFAVLRETFSNLGTISGGSDHQDKMLAQIAISLKDKLEHLEKINVLLLDFSPAPSASEKLGISDEEFTTIVCHLQ